MHMDNSKLFVENQKELDILIQTIRIYKQDIGMEFSIEKMYHANNEKQKKTNNGRNRTAR